MIPTLISDLALILGVAGLVTLLFKRLHQPLVLGYVVAGFLVSPHMPLTMSVVDKANIQIWADIGVLFLLFALGLDFSFKKIIKMGMAPIIAVLTIILSMGVLGICVGHLFGWTKMNCIFLGGMLAMSSTTIIYKAFDDMELFQKRFASLVMSVLILEDILAIVMMVMLSALAAGSSPDGGALLQSVLKIVFFIILWFVVGIFFIPWLLKVARPLMTNETLLVVSLGLCLIMAVISVKAGFSSAFGAFVMGSILAETVDADKIIKVVAPIKDLFGAVFFVSVGMLVDPGVLVQYWLPILLLVLTVVVGQAVFGTAGYLLSGQPLKTAMQCGFSMAQIGEFAFIIASLGLSLGVISNFLYPVVVAVSVITTFITPYMIRGAEPCYNRIVAHLPKRWVRRLSHLGNAHQNTDTENSLWKTLLGKMLLNTLVYFILSVAVAVLMFTFALPLFRRLLPLIWANGVCGVITVAMMSPFLRAMIMKNNHSEEFKQLWTESRMNRLPLVFTILARVALVAGLLFYICSRLSRFAAAFAVTLVFTIIVLMVLSKRLKKHSIELERIFVHNLHLRDVQASIYGNKQPLFAGRLLDRDIHIADLEVPETSAIGGQTLGQLQLRKVYGVNVSSILRGHHRINIPNSETMVLPGDRLQVIGSDDQLTAFARDLRQRLIKPDTDIEDREMKLGRLIIAKGDALDGKTLRESGLRSSYNCMAVGLDDGKPDLTAVEPTRKLHAGDILWIVGERSALNRLGAS